MGFFENLNQSIGVAAPLAIRMQQDEAARRLREKIEQDRFNVTIQKMAEANEQKKAADAIERLKTADALGIPLTPEALTGAGLPVPQTPVSAEILPGVDPVDFLKARLPANATLMDTNITPGSVPPMEGKINEMDRLYDRDFRPSKIDANLFIPPPTKPEREAKDAARKHQEELQKIILREDQRRETRAIPPPSRASRGRVTSGPGPSGPSVPDGKPTKMSEADKILLKDSLGARAELETEVRKLEGVTDWRGRQKDPEKLANLLTRLALVNKQIDALTGRAQAPAPAAPTGKVGGGKPTGEWKKYLNK